MNREHFLRQFFYACLRGGAYHAGTTMVAYSGSAYAPRALEESWLALDEMVEHGYSVRREDDYVTFTKVLEVRS